MALNTDYIERKDLLSNASATGSYSTVKGGTYIWSAEGTFSSATLQLQAKNANGTATDISGATLTAAGFVSVLLGANAEVRVAVTGSPSAIYSSLVAVP
jgi:hypothetical protein